MVKPRKYPQPNKVANMIVKYERTHGCDLEKVAKQKEDPDLIGAVSHYLSGTLRTAEPRTLGRFYDALIRLENSNQPYRR